ncbi:MAG: hypothetical protein ACLR06_12245 [Christensenellaceae bacterium]
MASGTVIKSASFAMNLTKTSWYGGYGVKIASAGTVKAGVNKTKVEVLLNAADLTYTSDASDATADVNVADVTKGAKVFAIPLSTRRKCFYPGKSAISPSPMRNWLLLP